MIDCGNTKTTEVATFYLSYPYAAMINVAKADENDVDAAMFKDKAKHVADSLIAQKTVSESPENEREGYGSRQEARDEPS